LFSLYFGAFVGDQVEDGYCDVHYVITTSL